MLRDIRRYRAVIDRPYSGSRFPRLSVDRWFDDDWCAEREGINASTACVWDLCAESEGINASTATRVLVLCAESDRSDASTATRRSDAPLPSLSPTLGSHEGLLL